MLIFCDRSSYFATYLVGLMCTGPFLWHFHFGLIHVDYGLTSKHVNLLFEDIIAHLMVLKLIILDYFIICALSGESLLLICNFRTGSYSIRCNLLR